MNQILGLIGGLLGLVLIMIVFGCLIAFSIILVTPFLSKFDRWWSNKIK